MADHATPNLPARDFLKAERFYAKLGFRASFRSGHWLILKNGGVSMEFFPWPDLDPAENSHGCCIRLDDLHAMVAQASAAGVPEARTGIPRLVPPQRDISGLTIAYLVDPDGNLLRLVQNPPEKGPEK
ncbi:bleomycin resistance protein [Alteraurantiacibacter aestuarii]|uniref:Bleomycin resistance protein n=1 Tax=Alteraurantiacibacter aestuarii TaxID=650004 RepID=A0A844ZQ08_9SPHN|nr:bleomycin resistance protein [Alteraurantiacibacter aestuarii]MXO87709.1 bleomycin resistance protein [Alteraurantiacibacter aestuarii]